MKTKWYIFVLFIFVLSIGTLSSAAETRKKRRKAFKPGPQKPKRSKPSIKEDRKSPQRFWRSGSFHATSLVTPFLDPGKTEEEARVQADFVSLPDVSVTCSTTDFVVRVKRAFYGLGADAHELTLGSSCKSNGVLRPQGDLLFTYPLTECDGVRELPPGYLVYKHVLHYEPSPKPFPSRAHQISVNIECHYQRDHSVHQLAVQPTWQSVILRKTLKNRPMNFLVKLMDDSWTAHTEPQVYLLGQTVNIQVSAFHLPPGLKLYINSCYATTSSESSLKYTIIDNLGCMVDSKHDPGASQFVSRTDGALKFSLRAFQFMADPETEVSIHCKVSVTPEGPSPVHKSCTYQDDRWTALTGRDSICECCESTCASSRPQRALMEGFASSGPLLVSDQPYTAKPDLRPVSPSAVSSGEDENISYYTDVNSHQKLWEGSDVEKNDKNEEQFTEGEDVFGETRGSDSDDEGKILTESEEKNLDVWKTGSGNKEKGFSEHQETDDKFEGSEDDVTEEQRIHDLLRLEQIGLSQVGLQAELEPPASEGGLKKTQGCKDDEDWTLSKMKTNNVSSLLDEEKTWYFMWT